MTQTQLFTLFIPFTLGLTLLSVTYPSLLILISSRSCIYLHPFPKADNATSYPPTSSRFELMGHTVCTAGLELRAHQQARTGITNTYFVCNWLGLVWFQRQAIVPLFTIVLVSAWISVLASMSYIGHHVVFPYTGNVVTSGTGTGACVEEYGGGMSGHNDDYEGEECFIYD
ncbi:hypothetical protein EMCG_05770 [[Emmonsia] crescens]|uniref:Uncharacterized protein n=1 Tax=[Emmonsia] crescens TaxID=73230 RepID=A0A0G2IDE2_9EURO|nr:hypothetical protein EMCG_05770 [Emmonsia crescens UAMH 3008]